MTTHTEREQRWQRDKAAPVCICGHKRGRHVFAGKGTPSPVGSAGMFLRDTYGGCLADVSPRDICDCEEYRTGTECAFCHNPASHPAEAPDICPAYERMHDDLP